MRTCGALVSSQINFKPNQPPAAKVTIIKTESKIPGVSSSTSTKRSCVFMILARLRLSFHFNCYHRAMIHEMLTINRGLTFTDAAGASLLI